MLGIVKAGVLVEVDGKCVTVANKSLGKITVCQPREVAIVDGERLHLKANRKLADGSRTTNGELVTVKTVHHNGKIELADGRILDKGFREFLPGYAVVLRLAKARPWITSYFQIQRSKLRPMRNSGMSRFLADGAAFVSSRQTRSNCGKTSPDPAIGRWRWN